MQNEKRLIDANAFLKDILTAGIGKTIIEYSESDIGYMIRKRPTVDAVEIPCRIGDTVWAIRTCRGHKRPQKGLVKEMYFLPDMTLQIVVSRIARGKFGKTVFLTEAEALNAINGERKENG